MANFTPQEIEQFLQEVFDVVGARQYIGARYVPIFGRAGSETVEWDDLAPYEPLTVVMHQGVSYVSRRYVPAGIPITDTGYWVETYRFNAQVEQYRQEVLSFQGQIDGLRTDLESDYVPFPDETEFPKYGSQGQVLTTLADGGTKWEDPVVPSDAQAESIITTWLDDHPEATTTVQDNAITTAKLHDGAVTNAKLDPNGLIADVGEMSDVMDLLTYQYVNLFDKGEAHLNQMMLSTGATQAQTGTFYTDFIPIGPSDTLTTLYYSSIGASNMILFNSSKSRIGSVAGVRSGDYVSYTGTGVGSIAYAVINNAVARLDSLMIVRGTTYPDAYVPYDTVILNPLIPLTKAQHDEVAEINEYLTTQTGNMFDKRSTDVVHGYYSSGFTANDNYMMTHPIHVEANVTYKYPQSSSMGTNYQVPMVDASGSFLNTYIVGALSNGFNVFTPTTDCYIRANIGLNVKAQSFMLAVASSYPDGYEPYGWHEGPDIYPTRNFVHPHLNGKRIAFDGDSICRGANDTVAGQSYPMRGGEANGMEWTNYGVSGATIAVVSGVSHNLCTYIDTIHTQNPSLDYLILEGGTNDADRITDHLGELTDDFAGPFDTSTFLGAMEELFSKAVSYYPDKKIGYIVAMKMASVINQEPILPERRRTFFDAAIQACEKWGIPYLDLWDGNQMNPCVGAFYDPTMTAAENIAAGKFYADGQHPTTYGYDYLSPIISNWIASL